jgi:short-subunit dehydrogenase
MFTSPDLALITGASSGIGAELARQLAAQQTHLILTARRLDRLESLAADLAAKYKIRAVAIQNDLNAPAGPSQLVERLTAENLEPTILINNAGLGHHGPFLDQSHEQIETMLAVDVRALTLLTRQVGGMMARRGQGSILNVASFAAQAPIPTYAVYSGAKAYVVAFSQALRSEFAPHGINVSVICPGFTPTEFFDVSRHQRSRWMRLTELSVEQVARAALRGLKRRQFLIVPGWWYKLNVLSTALVPGPIISAISERIVR